MSQQETHYLQETAANKLSYSARRPRNRPQRFNDVMVLMKLMSDNDDKEEQRCNKRGGTRCEPQGSRAEQNNDVMWTSKWEASLR